MEIFYTFCWKSVENHKLIHFSIFRSFCEIIDIFLVAPLWGSALRVCHSVCVDHTNLAVFARPSALLTSAILLKMMLETPVSKKARIGGLDSQQGNEFLRAGPATLLEIADPIPKFFDILFVESPRAEDRYHAEWFCPMRRPRNILQHLIIE